LWRRTERRERRRERRRREEREGGVEVEDCGAIPGDHRLEHFLLVRQQLLARLVQGGLGGVSGGGRA
jgi:hypothetical protein